ncbi:MAG TPA: Rrf2 family transcriptional regulator [Bryobacteraceae bacterium]|nr:Rrf2 family transcriptional regulator [Bryobacteraceae bacterium]
MFSQTAEYALRAVVWLADHPDTSLTREQLAGPTRVPADYLAKVMHSLARAGVVQAQRGRKGGFTLTKPADQLTILDVINAVDPVRRIRTCPLALKGHTHRLCPLHKRLDDALVTMEQAFSQTRISDLSEHNSPVRALCEFAETVHA